MCSQDSQEYITLAGQLDLNVRMLADERKESTRLRELAEKLRFDAINARAEAEKANLEVCRCLLCTRALW